jgi:two-component system cell cycle response regulator
MELLLRARGRGEVGEYDPEAVQALERLAGDLALVVRRGRAMDELREQAFVDSLTGCYNRRGFDEHLRVELVRARRYERPLGLMLLDVDGFKAINDEFGHQGGDHVLRRLSGLLTESFRTTDVVSRYGGDEFAVIFPETSPEGTVKLARRIREQVESLFPDGVISRRVTVSVGASAFPLDAADGEDLVARADRALYEAKSGGRNRVVAATKREE